MLPTEETTPALTSEPSIAPMPMSANDMTATSSVPSEPRSELGTIPEEETTETTPLELPPEGVSDPQLIET